MAIALTMSGRTGTGPEWIATRAGSTHERVHGKVESLFPRDSLRETQFFNLPDRPDVGPAPGYAADRDEVTEDLGISESTVITISMKAPGNMIRRILLIIAAIVVPIVGGLAVYAATLPAGDVTADAAAKVCRDITANRLPLPSAISVKGISGEANELSLDEALLLYDDLKASLPGAYQWSVDRTKQAYADKKPFYELAIFVDYAAPNSYNAYVPGVSICRFVVAVELSENYEARITSLEFGGRIYTAADTVDWIQLTTSTGLKLEETIKPGFRSRIEYLLSSTRTSWRKD